jgi:hypothetical protein
MSLSAEVKFVLNSRQLAFASMDLDDPARITPNHLLFEKRDKLITPGQLTFKEIIAHCSALLRME